MLESLPSNAVSCTGTSALTSRSEFFPDKLHRLLVDAESCAADLDAIRFLPNGRAFVIRDVGRLELSILPRYFKQSSFASFRRQLNLYGIIRIQDGPDRGAYHHPDFLRLRPRGGFGIRRAKGPAGGRRKGIGERPRRNLDIIYYSSIQKTSSLTSNNMTSSPIPAETTDVTNNGNPVIQESEPLDETSHATKDAANCPKSCSANVPADPATASLLLEISARAQRIRDALALAPVAAAANNSVIPEQPLAGMGTAAILIAELAARREKDRAVATVSRLLLETASLRQWQEQQCYAVAPAVANAQRQEDLYSTLVQLMLSGGK